MGKFTPHLSAAVIRTFGRNGTCEAAAGASTSFRKKWLFGDAKRMAIRRSGGFHRFRIGEGGSAVSMTTFLGLREGRQSFHPVQDRWTPHPHKTGTPMPF